MMGYRGQGRRQGDELKDLANVKVRNEEGLSKVSSKAGDSAAESMDI